MSDLGPDTPTPMTTYNAVMSAKLSSAGGLDGEWTIDAAMEHYGVRPLVGIRVKLSARGAGLLYLDGYTYLEEP